MPAQIYRYIAATVMRKPRSRYVSATEAAFGQGPDPKKQDVFHLKIIDRIVALGLLGNKIGMTQIFDEAGNIIPVTILKIGPCVITQVKTVLSDGYNAIQVGYGMVPSKYLTQPELGHLQKSNIQPLKYLKEFRVENPEEFTVGQILNVDSFSSGQLISITGKSTGKGFSGLQKRHNFSRGPMTHGSKNHRAPGSIGMGYDFAF